jgi:hypothetical protein
MVFMIMIMIMMTIMVSSIFSIWEEYFWVNNLS